MYTSPRRRSTQHIEIVFNGQLYNTADRQPLPAGPVRTATPRRRVSPYPLPRPAIAPTPPSNSRESSPASSAEDVSRLPNARSARGSITELAYPETSDDDDAGSCDGDAVGRSTAPLRTHFSADSSCDGWSNSGEDFVEEYAPVTTDHPVHIRRSHNPSIRRSPTPAVSFHPSSTNRDPSSAAPVQPLRTKDRITAQARALSRAPPGVPIRPSSSVQGRTESQAGAQLASEEGNTNKICKPPGEPGRPGSGGYNLQEKLGMTRNRYRDVMNVMNQLVEKHLQGNKSITKQTSARLAIYHEEVG
ncbi:hypothetical protein FB107DRAFT_225339 [Schizophyllum commune]